MAQLQFPIRGEKIAMLVETSAHVCSCKSEFQTIDVYDTEALGRILLLDGHIQLAHLDERAYHEALVHIPMLSIDDPRRALVVGGGDGGVLRELCKYRSLEAIDMVEIDAAVVDVAKQHLPFVSAGAFDDPRVNLQIADAFGFLKTVFDPYDLIVLDITDVYEEEDGSLSERLFTDSFYRDCLSALSKRGFVVTQADNNVFCPYSLAGILNAFRRTFPTAGSYQAIVPSFGGFSGYAWASHGATIRPDLAFEAKHLDLAYLTKATYALAFESLFLQI